MNNKFELVSLSFQLGFIIAIPIIAFGFAGKWLDGRVDSYPTFTLIGIFISIIFTSIWIYKKFNSYFKS